MKSIALLFLLFSFAFRPDGIDEVTVYLNGNKIKTVNYYHKEPLIMNSLKAGDTLKFECWTDWGGFERDAKMEFTSRGKAIRMEGQNLLNMGRYFLVLTSDMVKEPLSFTIHYDSSSKVDPWNFLTIKHS